MVRNNNQKRVPTCVPQLPRESFWEVILEFRGFYLDTVGFFPVIDKKCFEVLFSKYEERMQRLLTDKAIREKTKPIFTDQHVIWDDCIIKCSGRTEKECFNKPGI